METVRKAIAVAVFVVPAGAMLAYLAGPAALVGLFVVVPLWFAYLIWPKESVGSANDILAEAMSGEQRKGFKLESQSVTMTKDDERVVITVDQGGNSTVIRNEPSD